MYEVSREQWQTNRDAAPSASVATEAASYLSALEECVGLGEGLVRQATPCQRHGLGPLLRDVPFMNRNAPLHKLWTHADS